MERRQRTGVIRATLPRLFVEMLSLVALTLPRMGRAQTVSSVSGNDVEISGGSVTGIKVGMTGKICGKESANGKEVEVCPARFEVISVHAQNSTVKVLRGNAAEVQPGYSVRFDHEPRTQEAPVPSRPKKVTGIHQPAEVPVPDDPKALLEAGDRAFDHGEMEKSAGYFERLLKLVPDDPYATRRVAEANAAVEAHQRLKAEAAEQRTREAEQARSKKERAGQLAFLQEALTRALKAGDEASKISYAKKILAIDGADGRALSIRTSFRNQAHLRAIEAIETGDTLPIESVWNTYDAEWPNDGESAHARETDLAAANQKRDEMNAAKIASLRESLQRADRGLDDPARQNAARQILALAPDDVDAEKIRAAQREISGQQAEEYFRRCEFQKAEHVWADYFATWQGDAVGESRRAEQAQRLGPAILLVGWRRSDSHFERCSVSLDGHEFQLDTPVQICPGSHQVRVKCWLAIVHPSDEKIIQVKSGDRLIGAINRFDNWAGTARVRLDLETR